TTSGTAVRRLRSRSRWAIPATLSIRSLVRSSPVKSDPERGVESTTGRLSHAGRRPPPDMRRWCTMHRADGFRADGFGADVLSATSASAALLDRLGRLGGLVVAFSGGVDSAVVLAGAVQALGADAVLAAIADSPSLARAELATAYRVAGQIGAELVVLRTDEHTDPDYRANAGDRCYFCKRTALAAVRDLARHRGIAHVATGTHVDDRRAAHRP